MMADNDDNDGLVATQLKGRGDSDVTCEEVEVELAVMQSSTTHVEM